MVKKCYSSVYSYTCPATGKTFYFFSGLPTGAVTMLNAFNSPQRSPRKPSLKIKSIALRGL